jgi:SWI/SNF complex subunit SWI3
MSELDENLDGLDENLIDYYGADDKLDQTPGSTGDDINISLKNRISSNDEASKSGDEFLNFDSDEKKDGFESEDNDFNKLNELNKLDENSPQIEFNDNDEQNDEFQSKLDQDEGAEEEEEEDDDDARDNEEDEESGNESDIDDKSNLDDSDVQMSIVSNNKDTHDSFIVDDDDEFSQKSKKNKIDKGDDDDDDDNSNNNNNNNNNINSDDTSNNNTSSTTSSSNTTDKDDKLDKNQDDTTNSKKKIKLEDDTQSQTEINSPVLSVDEIEEDMYDPKNHQTQTHSIIIPSYASWFNMKKIHKIERESLPEFFQNKLPSKSPKIYLNYRNFMINSYRLNPNEFLTLTSVRRNLVGDVGTLMRVHRFLNKWGLINYQVKPQFKPGYSIEKLPNGDSVGLPYTGDYQVKYDNPRGLFPFDQYKVNPDKLDIQKIKQLLKDNELVITQNEYFNDNGNNIDKNTHHHQNNNDNNNNTNSNENISNTKVNENSKRQLEESFESILSKKQKSWSQEQLDKLVSSVKEFKNDWYKISDVVGKTPQECILQFLQIPIEDKFNIASKDDKILELLKYSSNFPITGVDNPVLSTLAFVSQLIDSDVAKAASLRASKVMDNVIRLRVESSKHNNKKDSTNEVEQVKDEDKKKEESKFNKNDDKQNDVEMVDANGGKLTDREVKKDLPDGVNSSLESDLQSTGDVIKDAIVNSLGIIGARSHLFATYEEREMHNISSTIVNHELSKIDLKLAKVDELEKIYERERKNLIRQQEEVFLDRLALSKSTIGITKKLNEAISMIEGLAKNESESNAKTISELLGESKALLFKPTKQLLAQMNGKNGDSSEQTKTPAESSRETEPLNDEQDDSLKPLSIKQPQAFQIWAP